MITQDPLDQTVLAGTNATFSVGVSSTITPTYQWRFNSTNIPDATGSSLIIYNVQPRDQGRYSVFVRNKNGSDTSKDAKLTVLVPPPGIIEQPQDVVTNLGANVIFSVSASGATPLSYQWRLNGKTLQSATRASCAITNAGPTNEGTYSVLVTNDFGSTNSTGATLTVLVPPTITDQPQSQTVARRTNVVFSVLAGGTAPLSYQWQFNTTNITNGGQFGGARTSSLTIKNVQLTNDGNYSVVVYNEVDIIVSSNAFLTVISFPSLNSPRLTNGRFWCTLLGSPGQSYVIEVSTNLTSWTPFLTNTLTNGATDFADPQVPAFDRRYFRGRWP